MKCEIIRDLLPSYIDGLTSEESNSEIEQHISTCSDCNELYHQMKSEVEALPIIYEAEKIKPFKKLNKKIAQAIISTVVICGLITGLYMYFFAAGWKVASEDMDIRYSYEDGSIKFDFELTNGRVLNAWLDRRDPDKKVVKFTECFNSVLDDRGEYPGSYSYGVGFPYEKLVQNDFDENDCVILRFKDKTETIYFKDIVKELNIK